MCQCLQCCNMPAGTPRTREGAQGEGIKTPLWLVCSGSSAAQTAGCSYMLTSSPAPALSYLAAFQVQLMGTCEREGESSTSLSPAAPHRRWWRCQAGGSGGGPRAAAAGAHLAQRDRARVRASIRRAPARSCGRLQLGRARGVALGRDPKQGSSPQGQQQRQEFLDTHSNDRKRAGGAHTGFEQSQSFS
jgi:hypothetical protein